MIVNGWGAAIIVVLLGVNSSACNAEDAGDSTASNIPNIVIHPQYQPRNSLSTDTGSSTYVFSPQAIDSLPQGDSAPLNEVLLHAPGVAQDSYGQLHIRGDHDDLQYRINGIILPEGISGFGQTLDTHFVKKIDLLTGALPAEYGYRTAGIVDITTKTGDIEPGGRSSVMVGSNDTLQGNQEFYGSSGPATYYFTGTYLQNSRGIEPPTASANAQHDDTTQDKEFGYMSYALDPTDRLAFIVGNATNRFEIPNNPGQTPNFTLNGVDNYPSSSLNENQYEHNTYAIAALQGMLTNEADYQFAFYTRYSTVLFKPDPVGDLIYNGIASRDERESFTNGLQNDFSFHLDHANTLRAGWMASYEEAKSDTDSLVFPGFFDPVAGQAVQTGSTPLSITSDTSKPATLLGIYLQDEWRATNKLTINYGARFDAYSAYANDSQLSPRLGTVYDLTDATKLHAGYARYFTPPPTELIAPVTLQQFAGTTGALATNMSSSVVPEKDNYFDAGITQKVGRFTALGVDAYYKQARNLLDEGQFGQALIFAPFNYDKGWVKGVEFTADYKKDALAAYANLAFSQALGKGVASGQYNFGQDELDYIASNAVHLDHDQLISGSAGSSYTLYDVKYSADVIFGSGLRDGFANTDHLPFYTQVNLGAAHSFDLGPLIGPLDARFSVLNLFDRVYEIRDGSGIGVFAPQYGPRRTLFLELSKTF
jgi:outer membrane receptor protein involved in Fe transport